MALILRPGFYFITDSRLTDNDVVTVTAQALAEMDECHDWGAAAGRYRDFIRKVTTAEGSFARGLCPMRRRRR